MKKILKLMLAVLMIVSFTACSGGNSTNEQKEVVENFFEYVTECEFDKLNDIAEKSVVSSLGIERMESSLSLFNNPDRYGQVFVDETEDFKEAVFESLFDDIKVGDIKEDGDTTTVKVTGKYLDYNSIKLDTSIVSELAKTYINENKEELAKIYREQGMTAYQIKVYDNIAPKYYDQMKAALKEAKTNNFTATFKLEKKDDKWIITSFSI